MWMLTARFGIFLEDSESQHNSKLHSSTCVSFCCFEMRPPACNCDTAEPRKSMRDDMQSKPSAPSGAHEPVRMPSERRGDGAMHAERRWTVMVHSVSGCSGTHLQGPHQSVCWLRPKRARHFLGEPGSEPSEQHAGENTAGRKAKYKRKKGSLELKSIKKNRATPDGGEEVEEEAQSCIVSSSQQKRRRQ